MAANPEYVICDMPDLHVIAYGSGGNNPVASNAVDWTGWTQLGSPADDGEVGFGYEPTFHDVRQQAWSAVIRKVLIAEKLMVAATLSESNIAQLQHLLAASTYAAGATPGTNEDMLTLGDGAVKEYSLAMRVDRAISGAKKDFVLFFPKVVAVSGIQLPFAKQKTSTFDIEWEVLTDTTEDAGERLAYLIELTNAA